MLSTLKAELTHWASLPALQISPIRTSPCTTSSSMTKTLRRRSWRNQRFLKETPPFSGNLLGKNLRDHRASGGKTAAAVSGHSGEPVC